MEELLTAWLAGASRELDRRVPQAQRVFRGEPIPLDSLLLILRNHLSGILTPAVASVCDDAEQEPPPQISADVFGKFPALLPLVRSTVSEWIAAVATFLQRLHRDAPDIARAQKLGELPPIESICGTASDVHAGAHPVLRVSFAGGGCMYYKPRQVTGEWLWHALLASIAALDPELSLPRARVLTHGSRFHYGWMEALAPLSAGDSCQLQNYWHAAGALLCLAQQVRMSDLHLGNIMATRLGPAVTDAECLATPERARNRVRGPAAEAPELACAVDAILATGLLPGRDLGSRPDVSGLFGHAVPVHGITVPQWMVSANGRYRLRAAAAALVEHNNAPAVATSPIAVLPPLLSGYRHAAQALLSARTALVAPGAPWRLLLERAHAPRVILRDTLTYGLLLSHSLMPRHLGSVSQRRAAIVPALQAARPVEVSPALLRMEARALLQGHMPRFTHPPASRSLAGSSGRPIVRQFTACSAAQSVVAELEILSRTRLEGVLIPALLSSILESRIRVPMC